MKKSTSFLLGILITGMAFGLVLAGCDTGNGEGSISTGDLQIEAKGNAVTITGYTGSAANVTIPGRIGGLPVTAIKENAFQHKQLAGVTIPNSVTTIGN
jgi:hypothetical protein